MSKEFWKPIKGYKNRYDISSHGRVYGHHSNIILKCSPNKKGYLRITLSSGGYQRSKVVHRLVAEAFIPNPKNLPQVNHKDLIKTNNKVSNLEWCTNLANQKHSWDNGREGAKGEQHYLTKITDEDVRYIREQRKKKVPLATLARKFKVGLSTISAIDSKQNWKHIC